MTFEEVHTDCQSAQTYEVSLGTQRLGHVSYLKSGGNIFITDLSIEPRVPQFAAETQILDALFAIDEVQSVTAIVPLSATGPYRRVGFVCDPSNVLLRKTK